MNNFYQVAVNFPGQSCVFTYSSDVEFERGELVEIPFGRGKRINQGLVLSRSSEQNLAKIEKSKIKQINGKLENSYPLDDIEISLFEWMSKYYHYSFGKLVFDSLPKILKRPRKVDLIQGEGQALEFNLSARQQEVNKQIQPLLDQGFSRHYIHGVTGSGKSALYISLMKMVIDKGQSVQFLLPEINLTPQFTKMFATYLNCHIYTYHSGVTPSEKYTIWKALNDSDEAVLVMGVRSSVFLPIKNLGLVVVDEEHDQSFKQTDRCTYNGRDVAIKKAQLFDCPVVLGSATPTTENYFSFKNKLEHRYYYSLEERVGDGKRPKLKLLDTKDRFKENDPAWPLLDETLVAIEEKLAKKEQVLVFINKLGYSSYIQCRNCGHQFYNEKCGCENNLRYFKRKNCLSCSHCEFVMPMPSQCPECAGLSLMNKGFGTEKVEAVLKSIFKDSCIERFDRDEIKTTKDLNQKLDRFHNKDIDILVGTQMLAKGHNFKNVNLVVILGIDSMLNYADFRSSEKTYQLVEQVAGRAGRYSEKSEVYIQTLNPEHKIFEHIQKHAFSEFYEEELELRQLCQCPPFSKIVMVYFSSRFRDRLISTISDVTRQLTKVIVGNFPSVRILGPTPMGIEKKANQFTWAIMLKSEDINDLHKMISIFESNYLAVSGITYKVDVDPIHIL
jgi:primosomal protein N' (replication factor Y) (superfamily II helicase)